MTTDEKSASDCDRAENDARERLIAKAKTEELLAWAYERAAAREAAEREAAKPKAAPRQRSAPAALTSDWQNYIAGEIKQHTENMVGAIGDSIGRDLVVVERDVAALRERVIALETELTELRRQLDPQRGLRAVPSSPSSLIA